MKQDQAIKAANDGKRLAQTLAEALREINVTVAHVTANELVDDLQTVAAELQEVAAWDGSDPRPASLVDNPKYQPEWMTQYIESKDANGNLIFETETVTTEAELDPDTGEVITPATEEEVMIQPPTVVYTERIVRNKQYNANIPAVIFQSTTGLNVNGDGVLQGTDLTVAELLVFLQVSGALAEFAATTPTGFDDTVGDTIEKVVTI
jgi:hypothetical protein